MAATEGKKAQARSLPQKPLLLALDYGSVFAQFESWAVDRLARRLSPVYAAMETFVPSKGVEAVVVDVDGVSVASPIVNIRYEHRVDPEDVQTTNLVALEEILVKAAEQRIEQSAQAYNDYLDEATKAVGNNASLHAQDFNWDTMLDLMAKAEWREGPDGQVHPPKMTAGDAVPALPEMTEEQRARADALMKEKRDEHMARRRSRRLR
jgi:hypothetical protein